jgi:hypothetical protein
VKRRHRRRRVVLWGGRPERDLQLGAARNWRRALIARAAAARDQAIAAGDLDAARQYAAQGLVVTAAVAAMPGSSTPPARRIARG